MNYKRFELLFKKDISDLFNFQMKRCSRCGMLYFGHDGHICINKKE